MKCEELLKIFKENQLTFFSGVPDSTFKAWMKFLSETKELTNIIACNECEAAANAAGYYLATNKTGVVYMQNSGLGKIVNPHTSLLSKDVYSIPAIYMIGWRGEPGIKDEPQHKMMGRIIKDLLNVLEIPYEILPEKPEQARQTIKRIKEKAQEQSSPAAIIIKKGTIEEYTGKQEEEKPGMTREQAIHLICDNLKGVFVSTTGKTSRELFEYRKARQQPTNDFYTVGSMGCCSSIANTIALNTNKKVVILDGDGAAIMQMGSLTTIGHYKPENLYHIVFDNNSYESTGGQPTVSETINLEKIALAAGYRKAETAETPSQLTSSLQKISEEKGPHMLIIKVKKGSRKDLGRPTSTPAENKKTFQESLK
jgi:phosphonopyruvate decarboxylase